MASNGEATTFGVYNSIVNSLSEAFSVCSADFDSDGDQDVATASWAGSVTLSLNSSSGASWTNTFIDEDAGSPTYISFGEFNSDNKPDLLTCLFDEGQVIWYKNQSPETTWEKIAVADCPQPFQCIPWDPDSDGDDDILCASFGGGGILSYQNLESTGLTWAVVQIDSNLIPAQLVACGDISGDGVPDVMASGGAEGSVYWYISPGWTRYSVAENIGSVDDIELIDIDGDGKLDAVIGNLSDHRVKWYKNPGVPGETWTPQWVSGERAMSVRCADVDTDGDIDIICSNPLYEYVIAALNSGAGQSWDILQISPGITAFSDIVIADINQDNLPDLVGSSYYSGQSVWCAGATGLTYPLVSTLSSSILQSDMLGSSAPVFLEIECEGNAVMRFRSSNDPANMGTWSPELPPPSHDVTQYIESGDSYCQYLIALRSLGDFTPSYAYEIQLTGETSGLSPKAGVSLIGPYPNPCSGSAELLFTFAESSSVSLRCFDLTGRLVHLVPETEYPAGEQKITLSGFASGLYLLHTTVNGATFTSKLAVTR